jgi:creatinine amidohydrolase
MTNKLPCKSIQRNASLDDFDPSSPRLDRHPLARHRRADAARWIAVLPLAATEQHGPHLPLGTDVMIARPIWRGCASFCPTHSRDLPAAAAGRDFHRAYRLSGHADAADRSRAEDLDGARRKRRARRHQKAGDGHEPWRQQRGDDAGRAGSARATRASRGHHGWSRFGAPDGLFSAEELRHGIHGGAVETSIMLARYPQHVRKECDRRFSSRQHRDGKEYRWLSRIGRRRSRGRRRICTERRRRRCHQGLRGEGRSAARSRRARVLRIAADVDNFDVKRSRAGRK